MSIKRDQESLIRMLEKWGIPLAYSTDAEHHYRLPSGEMLHVTKPGPGVDLQVTKLKIACRSLGIYPGQFWVGPSTITRAVPPPGVPAPESASVGKQSSRGRSTRIHDVLQQEKGRALSAETIKVRLRKMGDDATRTQVTQSASYLVNMGLVERVKNGVFRIAPSIGETADPTVRGQGEPSPIIPLHPSAHADLPDVDQVLDQIFPKSRWSELTPEAMAMMVDLSRDIAQLRQEVGA